MTAQASTTPVTPTPPMIATATSRDGTPISYRQLGQGPGILVDPNKTRNLNAAEDAAAPA